MKVSLTALTVPLVVIATLFLTACGNANDVGDSKEGWLPPDHEHPNMIPKVHTHPEAMPVESTESTGYFETEFLLTGNSCDPDFDPDEVDPETGELVNQPQPGGEWLIVAINDEYLFGNNQGFWLSSLDPETTPFTLEIVYTEEDWQRQCPDGETYTWEASLDITDMDFTGTYIKTFQGNDCPVYDSEAEDFIPTDFDCVYTWEVTGTRY